MVAPTRKSSAEGRRRPDRAATERALMAAARRLLERDGVLAGLSMQEVADEAGVNRGLIHHYFGSRQALLRAALETGQADFTPRMREIMELGPEERGTRAIREFRRDPGYARMLMLLALDDDEQFEPLALLTERLSAFEEEQKRGEWDADADALALTVAWDVLLSGYIVLRTAIARQVGMSESELDRRVLPVVGQLFKDVAADGSPAPGA